MGTPRDTQPVRWPRRTAISSLPRAWHRCHSAPHLERPHRTAVAPAGNRAQPRAHLAGRAVTAEVDTASAVLL